MDSTMIYTPPLDNEGRGISNIKKRHNSCWTLYVDHTVGKPNLESSLNCLSHYYVKEISKNRNQQTEQFTDIFLEKSLDVKTHWPPEEDIIPLPDTIYKFLYPFFDAAGLTAENAIIMMVYVERMGSHTDAIMTTRNWKRMLLGALLMASKVWDDQAIWNVDFCSILPGFDIEDMNSLERFYLMAMQFNVSVKSSVFAARYFDLRDFAKKNNAVFELEPLNEADAKELETKTALFHRVITDKYGDPSSRLEGEMYNMRKVKSENIFCSPSSGFM